MGAAKHDVMTISPYFLPTAHSFNRFIQVSTPACNFNLVTAGFPRPSWTRLGSAEADHDTLASMRLQAGANQPWQSTT
jgi:hypothetical protein